MQSYHEKNIFGSHIQTIILLYFQICAIFKLLTFTVTCVRKPILNLLSKEEENLVMKKNLERWAPRGLLTNYSKELQVYQVH